MRVLEVSFGFPTVIFTTLLLISLGYWALTTGLGIGDADADLDIDTDVDVDVDGEAFGIGAALRALDLHLLPISLGITIISAVGWVVSVSSALLLTSSGGSTGALVGLLIIMGAVVAGVFVTGRVGHLLRPVFTNPPAIRRRDLVGRLCTVTTGRVDSDFGQAETLDTEQSTHVIQVRCDVQNSLTKGSPALIVSVDDDGYFTVSPDVEALT